MAFTPQKTKWEARIGLQEPQLAAAFDALDKDSVALFQGIASRVGYVKFRAWPVELYKRYARLAMTDLWSAMPEENKPKFLDMTPEQIAEARDHEMYPKLKDHLLAAMNEEVEPTESTEDVFRNEALWAVRHLKNVSRYSPNRREQTKAARDFTGRSNPMVHKAEVRNVVAIDESTLKGLEATLSAIRNAGHLGSGDQLAIDAGVIEAEIIE